jgi:ubiquinone/menaquinone biosynthesis C-methylase UbiE
VLKTSSKIKYINGDLNSLVADRKIDITNIKFKNNYFDFIICNHILEHIQDDKKAMSEIFRVLRPGGEVILQVPISKCNKEKFEYFLIVLSG